MADTAKWNALGAGVTVLSTELTGLSQQAFSALGALYDNATNLNMYVHAQLIANWNGGVNFARFILYYLPTVDGTNYADAKHAHRSHRLCFFDTAGTFNCRIMRRNILLPPLAGKFSLYSYHNASVDGTVVLGSGNSVVIYPANVTLQG